MMVVIYQFYEFNTKRGTCVYAYVLVMTAASSSTEESLPGECEKTGGSMCRAGDRCLSNNSVCDGIIDCSDASDELDCYGMN